MNDILLVEAADCLNDLLHHMLDLLLSEATLLCHLFFDCAMSCELIYKKVVRSTFRDLQDLDKIGMVNFLQRH